MRIAATVVLLVLSTGLFAAEPTPETYSAEFFDTLLKGDSDAAIDGFLGQNPLLRGKAQELQVLKIQFKTAVQIYGAPFAVELVSKEDLSPSLHRRVYITKHEFHPITWEMYFYKGKAGWLPNQILFVDQYQVIGAKQ